MNRVRVFWCLAMLAFSGAPAFANNMYINVPNAPALLEHLVRHSDELLTETNLTRANQFLILNPVIEQINVGGGWGAGLYNRMLHQEANPARNPEYFIGQIVNNFRMETILLYDNFYKQSPNLPNQFIATDYAYTNAMAATYWYIEALRRSYVVNGMRPCWNQQLLLRRLAKLERLAWEIRELMLSIRYAAAFRFPMGRSCIECAYRPYRVNVQVNVAQNFVPYPFYYQNRVWAADAVRPVTVNNPREIAPAYDVGYWNQRFTAIDQSYVNGYQPQLPANYDQRPFTPVQGGQPGQLPAQQPVYGQPGQFPAQQPVYGQPGQLPAQQPGGQLPPQQGGQPGQLPAQQPGGQLPPQQGGQPGQLPAQGGQQDPLAGQQGGTQPGYPVGQGGPATSDVSPSNDYGYNQ